MKGILNILLIDDDDKKIKPKNYTVASTLPDVTEYLIKSKPLNLPTTKIVSKKKLANDYYKKDDRGRSKGAFEKFTAAGKNGYAPKKEKNILTHIDEIQRLYNDK
jgi:hypothetical protein